MKPTVQISEPTSVSAEQVEAALRGALAAGLRRYRVWSELSTRLGAEHLRELVGSQIAEWNEIADRDVATLGRGFKALERGNAMLVRWALGSNPTRVRWGIAKGSDAGKVNLGWLPALVGIVIVGAIVATAWYVTDVWGSAAKVKAQAEYLRQQTSAKLMQRAKELRAAGQGQRADALETALADAVRVSDEPDPGLLDSLMEGAKDVAQVTGAVALGGGALWLLAAYLMSQRSKAPKRRARSWRSPVTVRSPVSFRSVRY